MKLRHTPLRTAGFAAFLTCSLSCLGQTWRPCRIEYANQNQIDYASQPRVGVEGTVTDSASVPIANACVAIFTEKDHRFVAGRLSNAKGLFNLPLLPNGEYRLVVSFESFGIANMKIKKVSETRADAPLFAHMVGRRIDVTSYIDTKKKTVPGLR